MYLPTLATAYPEVYEAEGNSGPLYVRSRPMDPIRIMVYVLNGRAINHPTVHGVIDTGCYEMHIPDAIF